MSYCRWSESDVYMYAHVEGGIECCSCKFADKVKTVFTTGIKDHLIFGDIEPCYKCNGEGCDLCMLHDNIRLWSYDDAIEHLYKHIDSGDIVPKRAFEALLKDKKDGMSLEASYCKCGNIATVFYPNNGEPTCLNCLTKKGE